MTQSDINLKYYVNVAEIMQLKHPRCKLPKPKMKPTVLVTGWNEWVNIIQVESDV